MIDTVLIISFLAAIGVLILFAGIFSFYNLRRERKNVINKIRGVETESGMEGTIDIFSPEDRGVKKHFLKFISSLGNRIKPKKEQDISNLRKKLIQAGYRRHNAFRIFFGFKAFFGIFFFVSLYLGKIFIIKSLPSVQFMTIAILLTLIGFYLPDFWLRMKTAHRKEKIFEGFPDALDLMVVCVEAGMGLDAAINRVGEEMKLRNQVTSEEFRLLSLELRAGKHRPDAMRNMAMRTGLEDVNRLMTLLIQTDKFGTSMAQALRVYSDSMRTKRYQRAEEIAAKLPVKLVFPLVLFIFPAIFVVIVGPAIIKIYRVLFKVF